MRKISLIAAAAAASAFATSAQAADLGGNCCADLEERIAELEATTARKGNRKVSLTVSGFVNETVMFWDDGGESNAYVVTNPYAPSRFRFVGEAKINEEWKAGYYIEVQVTSAAGSGVTQSNDDSGFGISLRQSNWFLTSSRLGTVRVGQASPATDDIILGSPVSINHAQSQDILMGAGLAFRNSTTGVLTGTTIGGLAPGLDTARRNVVRYDTPTFQGFRLAAAWGEDDFWDIGLWMANTWGDFKVVFNIGYLEDTEGNGLSSTFPSTPPCCGGANFQEFKGSAGVLHVPTGLFVDGAWVHREFDSTLGNGTVANRADFDYWTVRGGLVRKIVPLGDTTFWGFFGSAEDANIIVGTNSSSELDVWGLGINQAIAPAAMDIYLVYKSYEADTVAGGVAAQLDDIDVVYTGAIIRF
ncbi:MAG: porin [Pseudomonadota bacterium]